jgi:hypothetical protein
MALGSRSVRVSAVVLYQELIKRQQELEKLQTLDQKIGVELKSLSEKMTAMQSEMVTYANIDQLKASNDRITALLEQKKVAYQRRCETARAQVNLQASKYVDDCVCMAAWLCAWLVCCLVVCFEQDFVRSLMSMPNVFCCHDCGQV